MPLSWRFKGPRNTSSPAQPRRNAFALLDCLHAQISLSYVSFIPAESCPQPNTALTLTPRTAFPAALGSREAATTVLFLLWIAILFGLMLIVAERFFCPSLELISEYLRLPPCVAGATLLSFGNGAPDVFTQLAAISQVD